MLGSVTALTNSSGNVVQEYTYSVFGKIMDINTFGATDTIENPFTYTSREWEPEVGLYYYRARFYDPELGRFISEDPIGFDAGDFNLYRYVWNDPINFVDPSGLFGWRDASGFVPILGSTLDAVDALKCGNYGMFAIHAALAISDLAGASAVVKGLSVGTMKISARKGIKQAYKESLNWNQMRRKLQKIDAIPTNSKAIPNVDWLTTEHIIPQRVGLPHGISNHPANLQTGITQSMNSKMKYMNPLERAFHLPNWMKIGAGGAASTVAGWFTNNNSDCNCK